MGELMEWCYKVEPVEAETLYEEARKALANVPMPAKEKFEEPRRYRVLVDDNFHYMDPDERYETGVCATKQEALLKAKEIVEQSLRSLHKPGMSVVDRLEY